MTLRVRMAGRLTALHSPGGGEVQQSATAEALQVLGVDARMWRPWEDQLADIDCLHLFGSNVEHLELVRFAQDHGVAVVVSTIAWFDVASRWRCGSSLAARALACGKHLDETAAGRIGQGYKSVHERIVSNYLIKSTLILFGNAKRPVRRRNPHFRYHGRRLTRGQTMRRSDSPSTRNRRSRTVVVVFGSSDAEN